MGYILSYDPRKNVAFLKLVWNCSNELDSYNEFLVSKLQYAEPYNVSIDGLAPILSTLLAYVKFFVDFYIFRKVSWDQHFLLQVKIMLLRYKTSSERFQDVVCICLYLKCYIVCVLFIKSSKHIINKRLYLLFIKKLRLEVLYFFCKLEFPYFF